MVLIDGNKMTTLQYRKRTISWCGGIHLFGGFFEKYVLLKEYYYMVWNSLSFFNVILTGVKKWNSFTLWDDCNHGNVLVYPRNSNSICIFLSFSSTKNTNTCSNLYEGTSLLLTSCNHSKRSGWFVPKIKRISLF